MAEITRQPTPGPATSSGNALDPSAYLPEMAKTNMAKEVIGKMGTPAIVSKRFVVCQGIFKTLNHVDPTYDDEGKMVSPGNPTGYDCSLRIGVYRHVEHGSINVDGKFFNNLWAYFMTSIYTINQQVVPQGNAFDNQEPGFFRRILNRITGRGEEPKQNG